MGRQTQTPAETMITVADVKALDGYRIWLRFSDGVEGEVDLSSLRGRGGFFEAWDDREVFENTRIADYGHYFWVGEVDLCPEPFYLELAGVSMWDAENQLVTRTRQS